ncbi:MAG: hypothetical protein RBG13Loki_3711 [Promethearchaeota archaeon CR_4]|nr:MAG: hypothetical protein RBG13Loki_3711 [Candidatus Lokiarchaeota archaeon CR_4]
MRYENYLTGREPSELKHLSSSRKIKRSDSLSSGERKGNSLNSAVPCTEIRSTNIETRNKFEILINKIFKRFGFPRRARWGVVGFLT